MANPEVDDDVAAILGELKSLRELDLNDTRVTDRTLAVLATLPGASVVAAEGDGDH